GGGELLGHGRELLGLLLDLTHHPGDRAGGPVHARAEVAQVVQLLVLDLYREVAVLHLCQRAPRGLEPRDEPRQRRHQSRAREGEHQRLLRERAPCPTRRALADPDGGGEPEAREVDEQCLPGLRLAEVQGRLQWRDQVHDVPQVSGWPHRVEDRGDHRGTNGDVGVCVPGGELTAPSQTEHRIADAGEDAGETDDEEPRDGSDPRDAEDSEQGHPERDEPPAGAGAPFAGGGWAVRGSSGAVWSSAKYCPM